MLKKRLNQLFLGPDMALIECFWVNAKFCKDALNIDL